VAAIDKTSTANRINCALGAAVSDRMGDDWSGKELFLAMAFMVDPERSGTRSKT
jgi:hypothetical protein